MRVSLENIALHLGLNRSTISRGLRGDPRISLKTRERIRRACHDLDYRPNSLVSELASSRWQVPRAHKGTVIAYIDGARPGAGIGLSYDSFLRQEAAGLGYQLEIFRRIEFKNSIKLQQVLRNRGITDVILGPVFENTLVTELDWSKFVAVQLLPGAHSPPLHSVVRDHFNIVVLAWRNVVAHGYQRIGVTFLDHDLRVMDDVIRMSAAHACQQYLFPSLASLPSFHFTATDHRPRAFAEWVKANRIDAVIGFADSHLYLCSKFSPNIAYASMHKGKADGVSGIYEDISVCAREGINLLHFCRRTHQWGLPTQRISHTVEPVWVNGDSLPKKDAA